MIKVKKIQESKKEQILELSNSKGFIYLTVIAKGSFKPSFYNPKENDFIVEEVKLINNKINKQKELTQNKQYNFETLDFDYSYENMNFRSVKNFIDIWSFGVIEVKKIKEKTHKCDCCGHYTNIDFKLINKVTKKEIVCFEDDHFGSGYLPSPYDLFELIID